MEHETDSPAGRTSGVWASWSSAALGHWRATAWLHRAVCVISAQPVGWRAILQALWINLWQDISRIKQNWMFNLTCPRAESSPVISWDREAWMWPTLGLNTTFFLNVWPESMWKDESVLLCTVYIFPQVSIIQCMKNDKSITLCIKMSVKILRNYMNVIWIWNIKSDAACQYEKLQIHCKQGQFAWCRMGTQIRAQWALHRQ